MNSVKLYSNGTGVFDRVYTLANREPLTVSIPIRNDSLDEAVASIGVFGNVSLTEPPSYTPLGSDTSSLEIDPNNVTRDLATKLRGARVAIKIAAETIIGRIAGIQVFDETAGESVIERFRIALFDDSGALRTFADREITSLTFTEESVQTEIDKALQRAFETIKPNSTFVNLTLVPNEDGDVETRIQYAVAQLGAWKISYRLRGLEGKWELEGQAVVDNSTDEPWNNVLISVISGSPISFSTDLAEIRAVRRNRVNIVSDQALDVLRLEEAEPEYMLYEEGASPMMAAPASPMPARIARSAMAGGKSAYKVAQADYGQRAQQEQAQTREIGDAVEYTAPFPVSIGANRSAIIPMFSTALKEAKPLLVYKPSQNAERPYRALRFQNETGHPLGRGVCTLFQDGTYVGKAILESCQPGEERTLPYALESGVRIFHQPGTFEARCVQVRITEGAALEEKVWRGVTIYKVKNNTDEAFSLEIEHTRNLGGTTFDVQVGPSGQSKTTPIPEGIRIRVELPAREPLQIAVWETQVEEQRVSLMGTNGFRWLQNFLVVQNPLAQPPTTQNPFMSTPAVQECLRRQEAIDRAIRELQNAERQVNDVLEEQERLKGLLIAGGHEGAANEWRTTLAQNERLIKEAKTMRAPQLRQEVQDAETALQQALNTLTLSWNEDDNNTRSEV